MNMSLASVSAGRGHGAPCPTSSTVACLLSRIDRTVKWLEEHRIRPLSVSASTLGDMPTISAKASPRLYILFSGQYERKGYRQEGAVRHEVYQAVDERTRVRVCWTEAVVCGI